MSIAWQSGSPDPNNANNLEAIRQWWANLDGEAIAWRQRLLQGDRPASELDWDPQKFDEEFVLCQPELRGITLYWRKGKGEDERNITAAKLELDRDRGELYIYPQSQTNVVIRVRVAQISYQTIELDNPNIAVLDRGDRVILLLRDDKQHIEIKANLSATTLDRLKQKL